MWLSGLSMNGTPIRRHINPPRSASPMLSRTCDDVSWALTGVDSSAIKSEDLTSSSELIEELFAIVSLLDWAGPGSRRAKEPSYLLFGRGEVPTLALRWCCK